MRHSINSQVKHLGHIGYSIKKEFRGKGFGRIGLHLAIKELRKILPNEEKEIFVTTYNYNISSIMILISNGFFNYANNNDIELYFSVNKNNNIWIHQIPFDELNNIVCIFKDYIKFLKNENLSEFNDNIINENLFKKYIENNLLYGIYEDDILLGFCVYEKIENDVLLINYITINLKIEGKDIELKLINYGIEHGKGKGCKIIRIIVNDKMVNIKKFIEEKRFEFKKNENIKISNFDLIKSIYEKLI